MVDSVLLVVDAVEGPMPQTRFVTAKAFAAGLAPVLVVNKIDRHGAAPHRVVDQVFDLFDRLGASDAQLDFPVVFASATLGVAGLDPDALAGDMTPLLDLIIERVPPPAADTDGPFQMQVSTLDYSSYVGVIGIGRVRRGMLKPRTPVAVVDGAGDVRKGRVLSVLASRGLERVELPAARAGDIVCVTGVAGVGVSDTICDIDTPEALPPLSVDEPTLTVTFRVNTSPFAGTRRQVPDGAPDRGAPVSRGFAQRRPARPPYGPGGLLRGFRARRTAPVGADRDHAARRLRTGGVATRGDRSGGGGRKP